MSATGLVGWHTLATQDLSHPTRTVPAAAEQPHALEVGMARTIDRGYEARRKAAAPQLLQADVRAGLANGSMARGTTPREATGMGMRPIQGDILLPHQVARVVPALGRGQAAVAWEVIGGATSDEAGWAAPVVGIRRVEGER